MRKKSNERWPLVLVAHPSAELYGSDRVLLETIEGLLEEGAEVVLALPVNGPLADEAALRGASVRICPSPVLRKSSLSPVGLTGLVVETAIGAIAAASLMKLLRPDVVYINTITIPLWPVVAFLTGRPSLIHIHEAEGNARAILRRILALPLFLGTTLVANSAFSKRVLASSFPSLAARTEIVTNGVSGPESPSPARQHLTGALRLVYVGRLSHRKGVDLVLEAASLLLKRGRDVQVTLVGSVYPGNESYEEGLRSRARRPDLAERVVFLGFQPSIWTSLAEADVVIVPSRADEPFGNTAVEAVLALRPAVVSRTSGLIEASAGFESTMSVTPNNAEAIAEALEHIITNWAFFRRSVADDALVASERNSTSSYRRHISLAVLRLVKGENND